MTREEAIKWINIRMCMGRGKFTEHHPPIIDEVWEAGLMAIEALSVDLVRCKECKYHYYADNRVFDEQGHVCDYYHFETEPNGYCHVGIRRKSDE